MIAMQYSFTLPADYDMAIIRHRIATKGHLLDEFPGLIFKAYLHVAHGGTLPSHENLYAPFYLWRDSDAMNAFLCGAGFAALTRDFGWPSVRTCIPWHVELADDLRGAICATREVVAIPPHAKLDGLRGAEVEAARQDRAAGALAAISAYDPSCWTLLRFRLWSTLRPDLARDGLQLYHVGHVSQPSAAS